MEATSKIEKLTRLFDGLSKDEAITVMKESDNIGQFLEAIGERKGGSGYKRFYDFCRKYDIKYKDHFRYDIKIPINLNKPIEEILVEKSSYLNTNNLKQKLLKLGLLENKCAECGNDGTWNGKRLALHMDHINGVHDDNRIGNLRILCPNCHSQTDTYCGKNRKAEKKEAPKSFCKECGTQVWRGGIRCSVCSAKASRKVADRPSKEHLLELLKTNSCVAVGKMYNVSDNTIKKWIRKAE